jgi:hypothetical protein
VGAGVAGAINYYFVRSWGRRAQKHFLQRHRAVLAQGNQGRLRLASVPALLPAPEPSA